MTDRQPKATRVPEERAPLIRQGLLRNLSWLTFSNLAVKPFWFVFITYFCISTLGDAGYGAMNWALITMMMAVSLSDPGLPHFTTREVARHPAVASQHLSNFTAVILMLGGLSIAAVLTFEQVRGGGDRVALLLAAGAYSLGMRLIQYLRVFFRAFEVLKYEAHSLLVEKMLVVGLGVVALMVAPTPASVLLGMATGMLLAFAVTALWVHSRVSPFRLTGIDRIFLMASIRTTLPIGAFTILAVVYVRAGPFLLEWYEGEATLGHFSAAYRIIEAALLLPSIVTTVALPRLSRYHLGDSSDRPRFVFASTGLLLASASALALGFYIFAPEIIDVLTGGSASFGASTELLRLLAVAFPLTCLSGLLCTMLIASNKQRPLALIMLAGAITAIAANYVFIPIGGARAVCLVLIGTEIVVTVSLIWAYHQ